MNTKFILLLLFLSCSVFTFNSCKLNDVDDPTVIVDIDDEFYVEMWEMLSKEAPVFQLRTATITEEACLNYEIAYQIVKRSNRIRASIDDIVQPDDCLPGKASATVDMEVGQVENGLYEFEINLKNSTIVNKGQLIVSDESYIAEMTTTNGIALTKEKLLRVPNLTIWGYLGAENVKPIAADFLVELQEISTEKDFLVGDYGHFSIADNNTIDFPVETNFTEIEPFIINYNSDLDDLKAILANYRNRYGTSLDLQVFTWQGEIL